MLDDLIRKLPPGIFASIAIGLGIVLIIILNPPHTACVTQNELLVENLSPLFFTKANPKLDNRKPPSLYSKYKADCLRGTNQGACLRWFEALNTLERSLVNSPSECVADATDLKEIKEALVEAPEMMVRLAWGAAAPQSAYYKNGWLDSYHLRSFCNLKDWYINVKGNTAWKNFREALMNKLPGSEALPREEVWRRSILSTPCSQI